MIRYLFFLALVGGLAGVASAADTPPATPPQRIISMGPNVTETLFAIGAGDQVVGVTTFCDYPPQATTLPRCGGMIDPNYEAITALRPDLIILQGGRQPLRAYAEQRGIAVGNVAMDSVETILTGIHELGRLSGHEDGATSIAGRFEARLARIADRVAELPEAERPRVFISIARRLGTLDGIMTSGPSFLTEAVRLAGGVSVFEDAAQPYPMVSKESLIARRPDVILEILPELAGLEESARTAAIEGARADWAALGSLPAVRAGRIEAITLGHALVPGPRFPELVERIHEILFPPR